MSYMNRRKFLSTSLATGAAVSLAGRTTLAATEEINVGFISCGSRARGLMSSFSKVDGVNIAGLCDPDESRVGNAKERYPKAKTWTDLRDLLDDKSIDAVVVATCNHWHCLAAIWAMESGKHVYVEKPLSHTQWEGQQTVAAARKHNRICQIGTQQRSDPMQAQIKKFLHQDKAIGEIVSARVNRYGIRPSIGKRSTPLPIDKNVAYDIWLGPAQDQPIYRDKLHYDWHWDWNTGSGEMGNWGVHVLDDLRNNVFLDKVTLPKRIFGGGGRVVWNDAGQTPNVHFVYFDTGSIPVVIGLANIPGIPGGRKSPKHPGPGSGYIAYCEGGRLEGQRGRAVAYDSDGNVMQKFSGNSGGGIHQQNFIEAVRKNDASVLNADVKIGHDTTGWCNLANITYRAGKPFTHGEAKEAAQDCDQWEPLLTDMESLLKSHQIPMESSEIMLSPMLDFDPATERFTGDSQDANRFLKREYRAPYVVPTIV